MQTANVARKWQKFLSPNKSDDLFIFLCFSSFCKVHITSGLLLQYEYVECVDTKGVSKLCELAKIGALSDDSALSYLFVIYTFKKNLFFSPFPCLYVMILFSMFMLNPRLSIVLIVFPEVNLVYSLLNDYVSFTVRTFNWWR